LDVQKSSRAIGQRGNSCGQITVSLCSKTDQRRHASCQGAGSKPERCHIRIRCNTSKLNRDRQPRQITASDRDQPRQRGNPRSNCCLYGRRISVIIDGGAGTSDPQTGIVEGKLKRSASRVPGQRDRLHFIILQVRAVDRDLGHILSRKCSCEFNRNRIRIQRTTANDQITRRQRGQVIKRRLNLTGSRVKIQRRCGLPVKRQCQIATGERCRQQQLLNFVRLCTAGHNSAKASSCSRNG